MAEATSTSPDLAKAALEVFYDTVRGTETSPVAMGVIAALTRAITLSKAMTMLHLTRDLDTAREAICKENNSIAVQSLCDLFKKYVTRTWADLQVFLISPIIQSFFLAL